MQPRKGCAQVKDLNADFDSSYWIQSPAYSASSPVYSPTFPAYSDNSSPAWYPTSPADSEDSDITASTSLPDTSTLPIRTLLNILKGEEGATEYVPSEA